MDAITNIAVSFQHPLLTAADLFFDGSLVYAAILFAIVFISENRNEKRRKILISLLLASIIATVVKVAFAVDRPCVGLTGCPNDYSFPSLHAATAFALMVGFLNKKSFPYFMLFALFISFTRLNLGVHTFHDIAGALPVALFSYYITDIFWKGMKK
jgi:membrane-associated phospholipid phosphatase